MEFMIVMMFVIGVLLGWACGLLHGERICHTITETIKRTE